MTEFLVNAGIFLFFVFALREMLFSAIPSLVFVFQHPEHRPNWAIPFMAGALVLMPPTVLLVTHFSDQDSIFFGSFWQQLRNESIVSLKLFVLMLLPLPAGFVLHSVLWKAPGTIPQFAALLLARLVHIYAAVPVAIYSIIITQGAYNYFRFLYHTIPVAIDELLSHVPTWINHTLLERALLAYIFASLVDNLPAYIYSLFIVFGGLVIGFIPIVILVSGINLSHQLFCYYYPWRATRRMSLWPASGYSLEIGEVERTDVLFVSDLHTTAAGRETLEPSRTARRVDPLNALHEIVESLNSRIVLATGDLTDAGPEDEWARVAVGLQGPYSLTILPGNHDYHFRKATIRSSVESFFSSPSFESVEVYEKIKLICPMQNNFPMFPNLENVQLDVLTLDSNLRPAGWALTNAIGRVGVEQLTNAKALLLSRKQSRALVIALHHHVVPPAFSLSATFLLCLDYETVLKFALEDNAQAIVHGHTHQPFIYRHQSRGGPGCLNRFSASISGASARVRL